MLCNKIPKEFYAVQSEANGNCMYNAVSTAIYGNEDSSNVLRFHTLIHAIRHFDHYFERVKWFQMMKSCMCIILLYIHTQFKTAFPDLGDAQQFLSSVIASDDVFHRRPLHKPTTADLINFAMKEEIICASKLGAYSGIYALCTCKCSSTYQSLHSSLNVKPLAIF